MAILPIYAQDILHVGSEGLGILRGAPSLGAVLTLMVLARVSAMEHPWRNLLIAITGIRRLYRRFCSFAVDDFVCRDAVFQRSVRQRKRRYSPYTSSDADARRFAGKGNGSEWDISRRVERTGRVRVWRRR